MKIGFCTVNCSDKPIEEVCRLAADHGYGSIEVPSYADNGQVDADRLLQPGEAAKFLKTVRGYGLDVSAVSNHPESLLVLGPWGVDTDSTCRGTKEEKIAYGTRAVIRSAQLANALETPIVVAFSGIENFGHINDWPYPGGWADEERRFVEHWVPIFDRCLEYGVKIAFEPHPNNLIYDTHSALRCLELCDGHPAYGINFDPANLLMAGIDLQTFIDALGERIVAVHAKDCELVGHNMAKGGLTMQGEWGRLDRSLRFRIPGWGSVDWKKIITELCMVGFEGDLNYEHEDVTMSVEDGIEKTIAHLKPLIIKAPYKPRTDKLFQK